MKIGTIIMFILKIFKPCGFIIKYTFFGLILGEQNNSSFGSRDLPGWKKKKNSRLNFTYLL